LTSGDLITSVVNFYLNQGGRDAFAPAVRRKAEFHLQSIANKAWAKAPWHWKRKTANISLLADGLGTFSLPTDYQSIGTRGKLYISGQRFEIIHEAIDVVARNRQLNGGTATRPSIWALEGQSAIGVKTAKVYRINSSALTLVLENYDRTPPIIVDRPIAPTAVVGAAGAYTGTRKYGVSFVTADGETEVSEASSPLALTAQKGTVTFPVSLNQKVTSRKLYATVNGGTQLKLLTTISDNVTTSYTDEILDINLGADAPTAATAVTGLELFPSGYHESVFFDGLEARLMNSQGDLRDAQADSDFMEGIRDMWINSKEDRSRVVRLPRFGATSYRQ
jgi:hypothetical protein